MPSSAFKYPYVSANYIPIESQDAQAAAADPLIQDILGRLSKSESTLSIFLGQDYEGSDAEGPRITLPDLLSRVGKLEEATDSATREADISRTSTTFAIEETSFKSLLSISADEEILAEATETLQDPATQPNP